MWTFTSDLFDSTGEATVCSQLTIIDDGLAEDTEFLFIKVVADLTIRLRDPPDFDGNRTVFITDNDGTYDVLL